MWREMLRMAWWNTGLSPKKGNARRAEVDAIDDLIPVAKSVIEDLGDYGASIIALGEVLPSTTKHIADGTRFEVVEDPYLDTEAGIGVLFDPLKLHVEFVANVSAQLRNRDVTRSLSFKVAVPFAPDIGLIAVHWPSRMVSEGVGMRASLGAGLQTHIANLVAHHDAFVVLCGDFNDDPFDASLTANIYGTRDRGLAKKQPRALYNPFFRMLGERRAHDAHPDHGGAGTCYWKSGTHTRWHTFDQFLFSSKFLHEKDWQLVESATEIWDRSPLSDTLGALQEGFDHYPVVVGIRLRNAGAQ